MSHAVVGSPTQGVFRQVLDCHWSELIEEQSALGRGLGQMASEVSSNLDQ